MTDKVAEMVNDIKEGEIWFTSLDMHYAYGQTVLHPETAKHCNFQIVGGESTGTYAFNTGCFGLDIMPPEFRKISITYFTRGRTHSQSSTTYWWSPKEPKKNIWKKVEETIRVLEEARVQLKLEKCQTAQKNKQWLGYKLCPEGIKPIDGKIQAITNSVQRT